MPSRIQYIVEENSYSTPTMHSTKVECIVLIIFLILKKVLTNESRGHCLELFFSITRDYCITEVFTPKLRDSYYIYVVVQRREGWGPTQDDEVIGPEHTGHFVQPHVAAHCGGPEHTRATCGGDMYVMYANALSVAGTSHSLSHT